MRKKNESPEINLMYGKEKIKERERESKATAMQQQTACAEEYHVSAHFRAGIRHFSVVGIISDGKESRQTPGCRSESSLTACYGSYAC